MISGYDLIGVWREYKKLESGQVAVDMNIGDYRGYVAGLTWHGMPLIDMNTQRIAALSIIIKAEIK